MLSIFSIGDRFVFPHSKNLSIPVILISINLNKNNPLSYHKKLLQEVYYSAPCNSFKSVSGKLPKYKLQQILDYISAYLDRDLSLKELGNVVQMSPYYFSRLFKETTGITPRQYIICRRIERAKKLLQQRKISIAEVAKEVGFVDQSHLHRHFKRLVGVTPKTYLLEFNK